MKHAITPIAGAILLLLSINTITLAQEADIFDKTGRKIHGTILSRDEKGIRFRKDDKTEVFIAWDLINTDLARVLKGEIKPNEKDPFAPDPRDKPELERLQRIQEEIDNKAAAKLEAAEKERLAIAAKAAKEAERWSKLTPDEQEAEAVAQEAVREMPDEVTMVNGIERNNMRGKITFPTRTYIYDQNHSNSMRGVVKGRDEKGIRFQKDSDYNKEIHIPWESIDPKSVPILKGEVTFEEAYAAYRAEYAAMMQAHRKKKEAEMAPIRALRAEEARKAKEKEALREQRAKLARIAESKLEAMEPKDAQKAINEKTGEHINEWLQNHYDWRDKAYVDAYGANYKTAVDLLKTLEIKDPKIDEKVTLRPEFKKIGASQLGENEQDEIYRRLQFACKKAGYPMPTQEMFDTKNVDRNSLNNEQGNRDGLKNYMKKTGKTITLQGLSFNNLDKLNNELLKDQIRKGRPCYARVQDIRVKEGSGRMVWGIAVGFETKGGITSLEIQLGTDPQKDSNYEWIPEAFLLETRTLWVE